MYPFVKLMTKFNAIKSRACFIVIATVVIALACLKKKKGTKSPLLVCYLGDVLGDVVIFVGQGSAQK